MKRHGQIVALRRLASAPRGNRKSNRAPQALEGAVVNPGRSPGFPDRPRSDPSQALRPVDLSDFVPGYSGGGRAGVAPASLRALADFGGKSPYLTVFTGPVEGPSQSAVYHGFRAPVQSRFRRDDEHSRLQCTAKSRTLPARRSAALNGSIP